MSKKILTLGAILLTFSAIPAHAADLYLGVSVGDTNYQEPGTTIHNLSLTGRGGFRLARFFDIEGRLTTSTTDSANSLEFGIRYMASAFAKFNWQPVASSHFEIYGLVGGSYIGMRVGPSGSASDETDPSLSYGFGVDLYASDAHSLTLEWVRYGDSTLNSTDYTLDNLSLGYTWHF